MKLKINGKTYLVTDMFVVGKEDDVPMRFNVFDDNYNLITSITCKDEEEFKKLFINYLKENKNEMV